MKLFHLTRAEYVPKILEKGLLPRSHHNNMGLTCRLPITDPRTNLIWLTDKPEYIIEKQIGKEYFTRYDVKILEVRLNNVLVARPVISIKKSITEHWPHEWICIEPIDPQWIKLSNKKIDLSKISC